MCFGESGSDTLGYEEQTDLRRTAERRLSAYTCTFRSNADAMTWAVLTAPVSRVPMPTFTICRIEPAIMVMVEDHAKRRRFASAASVEGAVEFACRTAQEALLAAHNVHAEPEMAQ